MNLQRVEYKTKAMDLLREKYTNPIVISLIFAVVTAILASIQRSFSAKYDYSTMTIVDPGNPLLSFLMGVIIFIVGSFIAYSMYKMTIAIVHEESYTIEEVCLAGVKEEPARNILLQFLVALFTFLWTLLFIIPGIVKSYAYSMSFYIANKEPTIDASAALDKSKDYTDGYKLDLFLLDLSYLGWYILSFFTLGILALWIAPRHYTARTLYFEEIYNKSRPKKIVTLD